MVTWMKFRIKGPEIIGVAFKIWHEEPELLSTLVRGPLAETAGPENRIKEK